VSIDMLTFDRKQLTNQLQPLPKRLRVAFAAACAQRQVPHYPHTSAANPTGNPKAVTRMLRELWKGLAQNALELEKLRRDRAVCDALIADYEERFSTLLFANNAVTSLAYALDTALSGDGQDAMWAAERACESLHYYIEDHLGVKPKTPRDWSPIVSFPIMQAELARQQADLAELHAATEDPDKQAAVIARIKQRAENDAASFFG
jgi:hypothetical protein